MTETQKPKEKYLGRSYTKDTMPHDLAVAAANGVANGIAGAVTAVVLTKVMSKESPSKPVAKKKKR